MSLLDDLNNEKNLRSKFNQRCGTCRIIDELTPEEAEKLEQLLKDPSIAKSKLVQVLAMHGHYVKSGVLTRHARGECAR